MRYLAVLLLAPWLLILGWLYWAFPRELARTAGRRAFDLGVLLAATVATFGSVVYGFDHAPLPASGPYGRGSGAIWQQVLPALYGYGACVVVLLLGAIVRGGLWRGRRRR
ncbi:hypothetical protein [Aerosticca soli]|uniref:Uncharacterized protein n=1 Tax=Aerosticca soli TaxID=2010829 RepID=A0A2Z6E3K1_9GAMM|nr:hypothetical protein [Aerosticca soli]BBD79354.1 hypothetical protein ALSL_0688 [Aerosticca soli]